MQIVFHSIQDSAIRAHLHIIYTNTRYKKRYFVNVGLYTETLAQ